VRDTLFGVGLFSTLGRILARNAPLLLAWFLAGEFVRAAVLQIAAPLGPTQSPLLALLLVPLAVLARLISYIGMFLVVRPSLPVFTRLAGGRPRIGTLREAAADFVQLLLAGIVPFFALYGLIGGVDADLDAYQQAAFRYSFNQQHDFFNVADNPVLLIAVIVIAFVLRQVLRRLGERLPRWTTIASIYLEATWVFVAFAGITALFGSAVAWVEDRQVVAWILDARAALRGLWTGFRVAIDGIEGATPIAVELVLLPLAWLLIAGIILTRSLAEVEGERIVPRRVEVRARVGLARLPRPVRAQLALLQGDWEETFKPVAVTGRMMLRAGIPNLALFVAGYAVLFAAGQWLSRGLVVAIGAHDERFWLTWLPVVSLGVAAVVEPVRIALLSAAFDAVLGRRMQRGQSSEKLKRTISGLNERPPASVSSTSA
jgi:hypothetical protein